MSSTRQTDGLVLLKIDIWLWSQWSGPFFLSFTEYIGIISIISPWQVRQLNRMRKHDWKMGEFNGALRGAAGVGGISGCNKTDQCSLFLWLLLAHVRQWSFVISLCHGDVVLILVCWVLSSRVLQANNECMYGVLHTPATFELTVNRLTDLNWNQRCWVGAIGPVMNQWDLGIWNLGMHQKSHHAHNNGSLYLATQLRKKFQKPKRRVKEPFQFRPQQLHFFQLIWAYFEGSRPFSLMVRLTHVAQWYAFSGLT